MEILVKQHESFGQFISDDLLSLLLFLYDRECTLLFNCTNPSALSDVDVEHFNLGLLSKDSLHFFGF